MKEPITESPLIALPKIVCKAENISARLPFAVHGLRVAYCVHSQRSELSLRIKKKSVCSEMLVHVNRATFSCLIAKLFLSRRGEGRDRARSASKSAGRESFERHLSRLPAGV